MEKLIFDIGKRIAKFMAILLALLSFVSLSDLAAQCPLSCNNQVQVSLNGNCTAVITPDIILEGEDTQNCNYTVRILGPYDVPFPDDIVRIDHIGMTLKVEVYDDTGNKCWGQIYIEDKAPPIWLEENPDTVKTVCYDNFDFSGDIPEVIDNCTNPTTIKLLSDEIEDLDCKDVDTLSARRTQIWQATDQYGNKSVYYTRVIEYMRIGLDSIIFPDNRDGLELPILQACGDWDLNGNDYPDPWVDIDNDGYFDAGESESGVPTTVGSHSIYPNKTYCEINATFTDKEIPLCEKSFKVLRNWTILDWCTTEVLDSFQIIKVLDTIPPTVELISEREIVDYADPYACSADVRIPPPINVSDCTSLEYKLSYILADKNTGAPINGLYIDENIRRIDVKDIGEDGTHWDYYYVIENLPVGLTWLRYTVTDDCGNITHEFTEVLILDKVPPNPVCDEFTVVTLTTNGYAKVFAETFDDGSYDNCTDVYFEVRRLEDDLTPSTRCSMENANYRKYVEFCCADAGQDFMVQLKVWDDGNGSGTFGDEIPLYHDTNGNGIFGDSIRGVKDSIIGYQLDNYNTCMIVAEIQDKLDPIIFCPPDITVDCEAELWDLGSLFGTVREERDSVQAFTIPEEIFVAADGLLYDGYGDDNCEVKVEESIVREIDKCQVGTISRIFTATDLGGRADSCTQHISVINETPFDGEVNWPEDVLLEGCEELSTEPKDLQKLDTDDENYGYPEYHDDLCSQLAITYEDQLFNFVDDVCFKILRHWTIIDWCEYEKSNRTIGYWEYTQVIKVNDPHAPIIKYTNDTSYCTTGPGCGGFIALVNKAEDCTPDEELVWRWEIDAFNDGGEPEFNGNSYDASSEYPVGTHKITWYVEDMCGNQAKTSYTFSVLDCKNPTPYCISEITTVVMPSSGDIEIWASDFDKGSFDNCPGNLRFSFVKPDTSETGLGLDSNMVFTCPQDSGMQELDVYVVDKSNRWDFCTVTINIQVNHDCSDEESSKASQISGAIRTSNNESIDKVKVSLQDMLTNKMTYFETGLDGKYAFSEMSENSDFKVFADKNDDPLNGVTTLDLVYIQRHLLGIAPFDDPYHLIAADVTNDKSVTASDILQLRKLILGIYDELPENTSWKFIDGSQIYGDIERPWEYLEYIMLEDVQNHLDNINFIGIKVGDVTKDATVNSRNNNITTRSKEDAILVAEDIEFASGEEIVVGFSLSQIKEIFGYQMSLAFNDTNLEFVSAKSEILNLSDNNLGLTQPGIIAMSWNDIESVFIDSDDMLFTLVFRAKTKGKLSENINISADIQSAELYTVNLEVSGLHLIFEEMQSEEPILLQNNPNPFSENTVVRFVLPEAAYATLTVFDLTGRVIHQVKGDFPTGKNTINLEGSMLEANGVLYYQLESGKFKTSRKMIKISR